MDIKKIEIDSFVQQAQRMYRRLMNLYQNVNAEPLAVNVLPQAFIELGTASEIVEAAIEELYQQNEAMMHSQNLVEVERQRYQDLFENAPDAYLVTDILGMVQEANQAAAKLLDVPQASLVGKPLIKFIFLEDRHRFRSFLTQLSQPGKVTELVICFEKDKGKFFDAALSVTDVYNQQSQAVEFRWVLRDTTESKHNQIAPVNNGYDLSQNRFKHQYSKGEIIRLDRQGIWYVCQGLVKLTTLCETGEEVLVGLAVVGMIFSSSMTSLHIYQATALSDVQLVSISLAEIEASPTLSHILSSKINQRLRQTESLLAISGRRRVQDRLYHLLRFLQQEYGQPVPQGTRLNIRLTHEEIASACCTTRVTITRLMGKLEKEGKISFESKNYIIITDV